MSRSILALVATCVVFLGPVTSTIAASSPSGSISCTVSGDTDKPNGNWRLRFKPGISSTPFPGALLVTTYMVGTCDNSGVTGGKAPITNLSAHLVGKLTAGTTCATFTSAPNFDRLRLKIKWQNMDGNGRLHTVATSSASFVDADWDDGVEGLVLLSAPLKGAFEGSTTTVTLTIDAPENFGSICDTAVIDGTAYGADGESAITIP